MKRILITCLGLLAATLALQGQELGLPDNSENKPARAAKTNTSYSATIEYPSHTEELYFDLGQMITYVRNEENEERRIEKMDSLVVYTLNDGKKTYFKTSLQGIEKAPKSGRILEETFEEDVYEGRWCVIHTYTKQEADIDMQGGGFANTSTTTEFVDYTDMETGILLRQDQNGGPMMTLYNISLGTKPGLRFSIPKDYQSTGGRELGKMVNDLKNAQNSDDPAAAMQDMLKNMNKYKTK